MVAAVVIRSSMVVVIVRMMMHDPMKQGEAVSKIGTMPMIAG